MSDEQQTLIHHLVELRSRLIKSAYGIILSAGFCYYHSSQIFDYLRKPIENYLPSGGLVYTAPMDKFMAHIQISIFAGLTVAFPWWAYQLWKFVAPALYSKEKKYTAAFLSVGSVLFLTGAAFAYWIALPEAFQFLMNYGGEVDKPMITIDSYLSFVAISILAFGIAFELPLVLVIFGLLDLVSARFLKDKRRYAVVGLAVVSAVLTPSPDMFSMLMMLVPMCLLYEISIFCVAAIEKKRNLKSESEVEY